MRAPLAWALLLVLLLVVRAGADRVFVCSFDQELAVECDEDGATSLAALHVKAKSAKAAAESPEVSAYCKREVSEQVKSLRDEGYTNCGADEDGTLQEPESLAASLCSSEDLFHCELDPNAVDEESYEDAYRLFEQADSGELWGETQKLAATPRATAASAVRGAEENEEEEEDDDDEVQSQQGSK
eukprot:gnl/Hemi2/17312_TR5760_c0_g1_i1.p1 gnl/Hemi2/17312_TR5760_c0_g1~~gnl/Hemi2/17312_TR5760_c0_g1_i1.p1  ORF type:complete len:185 (+),score=70.49 gnl/Hemi2/17312_TR5760_c0_g1_i1:32-586(+)